MLILKSSDGQDFEVEEGIAIQAEFIKNMVVDGYGGSAIPLPNVKGKILAKLIEYWKNKSKLKNDYFSIIEDQEKELNEEFVKGLEADQEMLFGLIHAANYLETKPLLDVLCKKVADMMKGKSPEELRKRFGIKNDYTPEEEKEIRKQNAWAFD